MLFRSVLGLTLAGLGTLIFTPLAVWAALEVRQNNASHAERVGVAVVILISTLLFFLGLFFVYLFVIHLRG